MGVGRSIWLAWAIFARWEWDFSVESLHVISCPGSFQNDLGSFWNDLNHVTRGRAPRGRPDLAGWLPRCVRTRTDGRVDYE